MKSSDIQILKTKPELLHKGAISCIIIETFEHFPVIISGGADWQIKLWKLRTEEIDEEHYIRTIHGMKGSVAV